MHRQLVEYVDKNVAAILRRYGTWSSMTQILDKNTKSIYYNIQTLNTKQRNRWEQK